MEALAAVTIALLTVCSSINKKYVDCGHPLHHMTYDDQCMHRLLPISDSRWLQVYPDAHNPHPFYELISFMLKH